APAPPAPAAAAKRAETATSFAVLVLAETVSASPLRLPAVSADGPQAMPRAAGFDGSSQGGAPRPGPQVVSWSRSGERRQAERRRRAQPTPFPDRRLSRSAYEKVFLKLVSGRRLRIGR